MPVAADHLYTSTSYTTVSNRLCGVYY